MPGPLGAGERTTTQTRRKPVRARGRAGGCVGGRIRVASQQPDDGGRDRSRTRWVRYLSIGTEFTAGFVGCVVLGWYVDHNLGTGTTYTLVGAVIGFVGGFYNLFRQAYKAQRELDRERERQGDTDDDTRS